MTLTYTARPEDAGRKIYYILRGELRLSASLVKRLKNAGAVTLNGAPAYTTATVSPGDVVGAALLDAEREPDLVPEDGELEVLFENEAMLIVNKPAGMLVHPSRAHYTGSLAAIAAGYLLRTGQEARCHVVNRLDRDTSGCVLFAKNAHWKTRLSQALADERAEKKYIALVCGTPDPPAGVIDAPIRRAEPLKQRRLVAEDGRRAVTRYETVQAFAGAGLVTFTLETGRTHQIRVHAAHRGFPLLGDALYGTEASRALSEALGISTQALHAWRLTLPDPLTGALITAEAPLRQEGFCRVLRMINA